METEINRHYGSENLCSKIFTALTQAGKDMDNLQLKDLAVIDQLHTGGHMATLELARTTALPPGTKVLDAGCGIGGSCRLLARECGFKVTGMDLVPDFIEVAEKLTHSTGLDDAITYSQGNILNTGLQSNSFDAVWCQHTLMNIDDKDAAFKEFMRILKPGGMMVLHEIVQGANTPIHLPVPWAAHEDISVLMPWPEMEALILKNDFTCRLSENRTDQAKKWWERVKAAFKKQTETPSPLGPHIIFGDNGKSFGNTMSANIDEDRIRLMEAIFIK
ncbi:Methyltransferase domain-containing protein [Desulfocicer vacuolatum DSM 3385]|uniref:Methyltransferase domain-containing protein n=1 Tax=Desulfocicer vacuolatum DSM 3385 TaxID=1121400 RepID=A0A1W2DSY1_9BACT|nr:class I SAM-dependent methyltransferase [Desulfocicer vacuolatum]SMD00635.1 Methyltransferase domain-containing protein [Desulfocicer vacuolatum DSM 3385]